MNKQKFIFIWDLSTGWNNDTKQFEEESKCPLTRCGSDGIAYADGRWGKERLMFEAEKIARKRGAIGFSVGYLNSHDPEEKHAQRIIPYTKI